MDQKTFDTLLLKAIQDEQFDRLLTGQAPYRIEISPFIGAEVPTDWVVLLSRLYTSFRSKPELQLDKIFENSLSLLMSGSDFERYCAAEIVFAQIMNEENKIAAFAINRSHLLPSLSKHLDANRDTLKSNKTWGGWQFKDGLWGELRRVNKIMIEDYGIRILDEDA